MKIRKQSYCNHQCQWTPINNETKPSYHEPSKNSSNYPISPAVKDATLEVYIELK